MLGTVKYIDANIYYPILPPCIITLNPALSILNYIIQQTDS